MNESQGFEFGTMRDRLQRLGSEIVNLDEEIDRHINRVNKSKPAIHGEVDEEPTA